MSKGSSQPDLSTVSCPCGASMEIDLSQPSPVTVCPDCGQMLEVVVTVDPKTRVKRVGILVKAAAVAPRRKKPKLATSGGKVIAAPSEEVHTAKCTCGAQLTIVPKNPDAIFTCSACDAQYTASLKQGKSAAAVLLLRPLMAMPVADTRRLKAKQQAKAEEPKVEEIKVVEEEPPPAPTKTPTRTASAKAPPAKSAARSEPPAPAALAARETMLLMTKGDIGAQEIKTGEEGSSIFCYCGEELPLRGEYHREILKCKDCGMAFRVFAATHPKGGGSMAVMIPRDSGK